MTTTLKLVTATPPRPVLTIVKALELDSVVVPKSGRSSKPRRASGPKGSPQALSAHGSVQEGGRNNVLTSHAGSLRRRGMSDAAIEAALQAENLAKCKPPLDPIEVSTIAASILRYPAASSDDVLKSLTDTGNAARFGRRYPDQVKYVFGLGWVVWDDLRWKRDGTAQIMELAKQVARDIYKEGEALDDDDARVAIARHAKASHQAPRLKAMLELALSLPALVTEAKLLDAHDMLLGVANGVVNLKTGKLQPARREDLMTRHSPVEFDPKAKCPLFEMFIDQVTGGDKAIARYLQRVVGYALSGATSEQCLFFLYGNGANGKSVFLNVVKALLGSELAKQTAAETLMAKRSSQTNDLASLHSVRAAIANEVEDGTQLAEALVKQMTGGDAVKARFHYQEFFEFVPKFKLFIAGNHKPIIHGRDNGIWRRIRLIPFEVTFAAGQQDRHLLENLRSELPGILNWAIKGCRDWQKMGLATPKVVADAVDGYRQEMDIIGQWVEDERFEKGPRFETKAGEAYQSYKFWCERNGYRPMAAGTFGRDFGGRYHKAKRKDGNYYIGIKVV